MILSMKETNRISQQEVVDFKPHSIIREVDIPSVLRDKRGRIIWQLPEYTPEQNEELGIRNVQALFLEKFPEFDERFPRTDKGMVPEDKKIGAKEFILGTIGSREQFRSMIIRSPHSVPYFERSHLAAIQKSFTPWGLNFTEFIPVDRDQFVPVIYIRKKFRISSYTAKQLLEKVTSISGPGKKGKITIFYEKDAAEKVIKAFLALPTVDRQSSRFADGRGETWVSLYDLSEELGIDQKTLKTLTKTVQSIQGRGRKKKKISLYKESEVRKLADSFLSLQHVNQETGEYTDENNVKWVGAWNLSNKVGRQIYSILNNRISIPTMQARGRNSKIIKLFNEEIALQVLEQIEAAKRQKQNPEISPEDANEELMRFLEVKDE